MSYLGQQLLVPHYGGTVPQWKIINSTSPIALWLLDEAGGTVAADSSGNGRNGAYKTDVSGWPPQSTGVDGKTAPYFSGDDTVDVQAIRTFINGGAGSMMVWAKVPAAQWLDGVSRRFMWFWADNSNLFHITKSSTNNIVSFNYTAGGTAKGVNLATNTTDILRLVMTWDINAGATGEMIAYVNGVQTGTTQTGLGTWVGTVSSFQSRIGSLNATPSNPFIGNLFYCALWDRALAPTEVGQVSQLPPFSVSMAFTDDKIRFTWLTDSHVEAGTSSTSKFYVQSAVADTNDWKPNFLLSTGDIGNNQPENVREGFIALSGCGRPVIAVNGNHDEFEAVIGTPNTEELESEWFFNRDAPFYYTTTIQSGDGSLIARVLVLDCNFYTPDPDDPPPGNHPTHVDGDRIGYYVGEPGGGYIRQIPTHETDWIAGVLTADTTSDIVLVFVHYPPSDSNPLNYKTLADKLQADGRPTIGFCGHSHQNAMSYTLTSTDGLKSYTFYKCPAMQDSGAWTRVTLSYSGDIVIDGMVIYNYTDPGGWTINAPFTLTA